MRMTKCSNLVAEPYLTRSAAVTRSIGELHPLANQPDELVVDATPAGFCGRNEEHPMQHKDEEEGEKSLAYSLSTEVDPRAKAHLFGVE